MRSDVVKAVCLGAKAVGLGRTFLYAQSVSGRLVSTARLD
jgi:L-lactate dehydrogenase (cytochrome)